MVAHVFNPRFGRQRQADLSICSMPALSIEQAPGQPELQRETLSQEKRTENIKWINQQPQQLLL